MTGTIERRLLINYRVDSARLERLLPAPFRPQALDGAAMVGICMIRLAHLRPLGLPESFGLTTENAAHRVAVEWDGPEGPCRGVYIPRRDTSSRLTVLLGGRLFPGEHHRADFDVRESGGRYEVAFASADGSTRASMTAKVATSLPPGSVFVSLERASAFFERAAVGYSDTRRPGHFEGLELQCATWKVEPLLVEQAQSTLFEETRLFPAGTVEFDSALVMRGIPAIWRAYPPLEAGRLRANSASIHADIHAASRRAPRCA